MGDPEERRRLLESEIERRLSERFAALRDEFDRLRIESDGRWAGFADRLEQRMSGVVPKDLLGPESSLRPSERGRLSFEAARELDSCSTQVEILDRLLDLCRRHASRAALLVLRGGEFGVWKASGISGGPEAENRVRQVTLTIEDGGALERVARGMPCRFFAGHGVSIRLSCADAVEAILVPIVIRDRVAGAVYADASPGEEDRFDPEAVALIVLLSGFLVERLPGRQLKPSPALRPFENIAAKPPSADEDEQIRSIWRESSEAVRPDTAPVAPSGSEPGPVRAEAATPGSTSGRRLTGPLAPPDEEERRAEARRFAQLLVSEIKLYNERAVEEGRAQGNLYKRLKEEIDLSRQMYEQRIPESVRAGNDFLYEELVRILADGRPDALGM